MALLRRKVRLRTDLDLPGRFLRAGTVTEDLGELAEVLVAEGRAEWLNASERTNGIRTMERRPRGGREAV